MNTIYKKLGAIKSQTIGTSHTFKKALKYIYIVLRKANGTCIRLDFDQIIHINKYEVQKPFLYKFVLIGRGMGHVLIKVHS